MTKLETMSKADLAKQRADMEAQLMEIRKAETEFDGRRLKELRAEIEAMLSKEGYSLADLTEGRAPRKAGAKTKAAPKYRHPENPSITWSGRGRQPDWFKAAIEAGKSREDMAI